MKMQQLAEGKVKLSVPAGRPWDAAVFFNPEAEVTRDISIAALQVFQKMRGERLTVCDALAGTGARGLRYAKDVQGIKSVVLNDNNPVAVRLVRRNIRANRLGRICTATKSDANVLLSGKFFGVVDLDPFGPPVPFLDSAARSVLWNGALAITATDTSALAGSYPEASLRKYGVHSMPTDYYAELGVRILISAIISACARHEKAFVPLLSFASSHYYRVFGSVKHSRTAADNALEQFGLVSHCFSCGNRTLGKAEYKCKLCGAEMQNSGPMYLGPIADRKFCRAVLAELNKRNFRLGKDETKLLRLLAGEAKLPPLYYDVHVIAKLNRKSIPKQDVLLKGLKKMGFAAGRTHFCPTAVKTDAGLSDLLRLLRAHRPA